MSYNMDFGGVDLIINTLATGASTPGAAGTAFPAVGNIDTTNTAKTITGVKTFSANPVFTVGNTIKTNVAATTLTSNAATVTSYFTQVTSEALTTAAGSSQAFVITLTGVGAGDIAFVQGTGGGTNTRVNHRYTAACTSNTITVTVFNTEPTNALNGTLIFNLMVLKA